jgi:hypothetical protein
VSAIGEPLLQLGSAVGTREIANGAARALKWKAENPRGTADDWFQAERRPAMERKRSSSDNNLR